MTTERPKVCPYPWQAINVDWSGRVRPCCYIGGEADRFGSLTEQDIHSIWFGAAFNELRKAWSEGRIEDTGCENCSLIKNQGLPEYMRFPLRYFGGNVMTRNLEKNFTEFSSRKYEITTFPTIISYSPTTFCNIKCNFCYQIPVKKHTGTEQGYHMVETLTPYLQQMSWGGGEPTVQPELRRWVRELDRTTAPNVGIAMVTNGTFLDEKTEDAISSSPHAIINVSMDGWGAEVYESIREGGSWQDLHKNILKLVEIRERNKNVFVTANFLWQRSNFHHLPEFLEECARIALPVAILPLSSWPVPLRLDLLRNGGEEWLEVESTLKKARAAAAKLDEAVKAYPSPIDGGYYLATPFLDTCEELLRTSREASRDFMRIPGRTEPSVRYVVAYRANGEVMACADVVDGAFSIDADPFARFEAFEDIYLERKIARVDVYLPPALAIVRNTRRLAWAGYLRLRRIGGSVLRKVGLR